MTLIHALYILLKNGSGVLSFWYFIVCNHWSITSINIMCNSINIPFIMSSDGDQNGWHPEMAVTRWHYFTRLEGLDLALRFIVFCLCLVFQHVVFHEVPVIHYFCFCRTLQTNSWVGRCTSLKLTLHGIISLTNTQSHGN